MIRFDKNIGIFEFVEQLNEQLAPSFKIVDCTPADAADYMLFSVAKVTLEDVPHPQFAHGTVVTDRVDVAGHNFRHRHILRVLRPLKHAGVEVYVYEQAKTSTPLLMVYDQLMQAQQCGESVGKTFAKWRPYLGTNYRKELRKL